MRCKETAGLQLLHKLFGAPSKWRHTEVIENGRRLADQLKGTSAIARLALGYQHTRVI